MDTQTTATLGMLFALLGFAATFLMYHLWGYPFDKETRTSSAPKWAMYLHRVLGYGFAACYVALMFDMVPRLWEYQVEFPARTVAHLILGFAIGFILILKISIIRFFRHFEEWMPFLGTSLLFCTVLLLGLSLPFVVQEKVLAQGAPGGDFLSEESRQRVVELLPRAKLPKETKIDELATKERLRQGRDVLLNNCVRCHDLKTILLKPRTPEDWYRTVVRMASKPALFDPLTSDHQLSVTAYLVAITPDLQKSAKALRGDQSDKQDAEEAAATTKIADADAMEKAVDPEKAKALFEEECSLCHDLEEVEKSPPQSLEEVDQLIDRMIANDLELEPDQIAMVKWYLAKRFVTKDL